VDAYTSIPSLVVNHLSRLEVTVECPSLVEPESVTRDWLLLRLGNIAVITTHAMCSLR
jgi:hypothetical protein